MLDIFKNHRLLYLFGISITIIGMPYSHVIMSIGMFWLAVVWLLEGKTIVRFKSFFKNKPALSLSLFFIIHVIGLLYSQDWNHGLKDLRIKLPLLFLPIVFSTTSVRFKKKDLELLLHIFVGAVLFFSIYGYLVFKGFLPSKFEEKTYRSLSYFISHVRFAIEICFAFFILLRWVYKRNKYWLLYSLISIWLIFFLIQMQSITGFIILPITGFLILIREIQKSNKKKIVFGLSIIALSILGGSFWYISKEYNTYFTYKEDVNALPEKTIHGEKYLHEDNNQLENGYYLWKNFAQREFILAWCKRSELDYQDKDKQGNIVGFTARRYVTSKGLKKDKEGIYSLTDQDMKNIENGIHTIVPQKSGISSRLNDIFYEIDHYRNTGDPSGQSLSQRIEAFSIGIKMLKANWIYGTGTGDIHNDFINAYDTYNSKLSEEFRIRAHNQYLIFFVTFGILGGIICLLCFIYPIWQLKKQHSYYYVAFILCIAVSFTWGNTLETQAGLTFFAVFNPLLLFHFNKSNAPIDS